MRSIEQRIDRRVKFLPWLLLLTPILVSGGCLSQSDREELFVQRSVEARNAYSVGDDLRALELLLENERLGALTSADGHLMGRILFLREETERAEHYWLWTLQQERHHIDTRKWLARLYLSTDRAEDARVIIEEGLAISAEDPELSLLQGLAQRNDGDLEAAIESFLRVRLLGERLVEAFLELATIYRVAGDAQRSLQELRRAEALLSEESLLRPALQSLIDGAHHSIAQEELP